MTAAQRLTLAQLKAQGFALVVEGGDIVRVTRHGDNRVIMTDGSQKRAHHVATGQAKPRGLRP